MVTTGNFMAKLKSDLNQLVIEVEDGVAGLPDMESYESYRVEIFGKRGRLTAILRKMGKLSLSDRALIGKLANRARAKMMDMFDGKYDSLQDHIDD